MNQILAKRMKNQIQKNADYVPMEFILEVYPANKLFEKLYRGTTEFEKLALEGAAVVYPGFNKVSNPYSFDVATARNVKNMKLLLMRIRFMHKSIRILPYGFQAKIAWRDSGK